MSKKPKYHNEQVLIHCMNREPHSLIFDEQFINYVRATLTIFSGINYVQDSKVLYFSSEKRAKKYVRRAKNNFLEKK